MQGNVWEVKEGQTEREGKCCGDLGIWEGHFQLLMAARVE